jgi:DNA topoisomerase III
VKIVEFGIYMKTLVIAEKPSVAADFVKVLPGKFTKEKTHFEGDSYVVSYAVGHLLTISDPGEMSDQYKAWTLNTLPILPEAYPLKPLPSTRTQLSALGKLIRRKDITTIVNACDAGREGELIFRYIMQYVGEKREIKKPIQRLWLQSMTADSIKKAFAALRNDETMKPLQDAAMSRSEADWLVGINGSRGLTAYNSKFGGFHLTPCGRVQTPTLTLIVKREEERNAFVPQTYWNIEALFGDAKIEYQGKWFLPDFTKEESKPHALADRIWDEATAQNIVQKCTGQPAKVEEQTKPATRKCPPLYDLTSLQREANNRFGFSAKRTLQVAQSLYERYKLTTYPRTDSKALPEDYVQTAQNVAAGLLKTSLSKAAQKALDNGYITFDKRIFNNAKVSDHHAIIPTGSVPKDLGEAEAKIFMMIAQRFLAVFYPVAEYLNTTRITTVQNETFKTEGKVLTKVGWLEVYGKEAEDEADLQPLLPNQAISTKQIQSLENQTKAPARYTESTLLSIMESAGKLVEDEELKDAMKERGLGTPATRSAVIEKLIADKYLVREAKELIPTSKAFDLIRLTSAMNIETLTSPELTGEWEYKLNQMEQGKYGRDAFMQEIKDLTQKMVSHIKDFKEDDTKKEAAFSPVNGEAVFETVSRYETQSGIMIRKMLGGRLMSEEEVKALLEKRKIGPLAGFRSKKGSSFSAAIIINDQDKVEFVFEDNNAELEQIDFSKQEPIGTSPIDDSPVYETLTAFISKSAIEKEKTGLRVSKMILNAEISRENMQKMLQGEKTELIKNFQSARTRKNFDAFLKLEKGKIAFEFPPRKKFARKKKTE